MCGNPETFDGLKLAFELSTRPEEQRNKLARCLFEEVWLDGKSTVVVRPVLEFEPFFRLNYEDFVRQDNEVATPRGFEPPISTVTGWHVGPLHHGAAL